MNKRIITLIIALAAVCGCQKTEKTIYKVPLSEHAMELERQERAYNDSLEKYSALLDTAQVRYYFDLHKAALDTLSIGLRQEAEALTVRQVGKPAISLYAKMNGLRYVINASTSVPTAPIVFLIFFDVHMIFLPFLPKRHSLFLCIQTQKSFSRSKRPFLKHLSVSAKILKCCQHNT